MSIFLIPIMAILSRMAGGGMGAHVLPNYLTYLPEVLFALVIGLVVNTAAPVWLAALCAVWSYAWMQSGHANALPWGDGSHNPLRTNTLSPVVKKLATYLDIPYFSTNYARLYMAVKGFLIGLPLGGIPLAILWPLGYELGARLRQRVKFDAHAVAEGAAGAGAGIAAVLFLGVT